eukprot:308935_1
MSSSDVTQHPFKQIDQCFHAWKHRYGSVQFNVEEETENKDGTFISCMNHNCFVEEEIHTELGEYCEPNECAYVWALNDFISPRPFPIPPYLHIPEENKDAFTFYILQWMYIHNACPSDANIKDRIMPLVGGELVHDDKSDAYYACIDHSLDTEAKKWTDNLSSARYRACQQDILSISRITSELDEPSKSLIRLVSIFDGANNVQLMNDLIVHVMLTAKRHGCHDIINRVSFQDIFLQFVQRTMPHYPYDHRKLHQYMRALYDMAIPRWYGYKGIQQVMDDISPQTESDHEADPEEKHHHLEDPRLPYDATKVQTIFGAFVACASSALLSYDVMCCSAVLMLKSEPLLSADIGYYIGKFDPLFESKDHIAHGLVYWVVDESVTIEGPHYVDTMAQITVEDRHLEFKERMRAKSIFTSTSYFGIAIYKFGKRIQCDLHNLYPLSVVKVVLPELGECLRHLFKGEAEYKETNAEEATESPDAPPIKDQASKPSTEKDTAFDTQFWECIKARIDVENWSDFDPEFDKKLVQLRKWILKTAPESHTQIFGIERIVSPPNVLSSDKQYCLFNALTKTEALYVMAYRRFGDKAIVVLNLFGSLQWNEMIENALGRKIDGQIYTLYGINLLLKNRKKQELYTIIVLSNDSQCTYKMVTAAQALKMYGISKNELPLHLPENLLILLHDLMKRYLVSQRIGQRLWFQEQLQQFVTYWNQKKHVKRLNYNELHTLFLDESIPENYHRDHVARCLHMFLKKSGYNISREIVQGIFKAMDPNTNRYSDVEFTDSDDIGKELDYVDHYVERSLPNSSISSLMSDAANENETAANADVWDIAPVNK